MNYEDEINKAHARLLTELEALRVGFIKDLNESPEDYTDFNEFDATIWFIEALN